MFYILAIADAGRKDVALDQCNYFVGEGEFSPDKRQAVGYCERHQAEYDLELIGDITPGYKPVIVYSPDPSICD